MKAILIDSATRNVSEVNFDGDWKSIAPLIGCQTFAVVYLNNGDVVYVDDEGLLGTPNNFFELGDIGQPIAGNGLIVGSTDDGDNTDCLSTVNEIRNDVIFMDEVAVMLKSRLGGW